MTKIPVLPQITTPINTSLIPIEQSGVTSYLTWLNTKNTLKTYFDTLYVATGSGGGDMLKTTYDPTLIEGDAFDSANTVYDPALTNLSATTVKTAIDEIQTNNPGIQFDTTNTTSPNEGQVVWNDNTSSLEVGMGGDVVQQIGEELYIKAKALGSNINNGQVVYIASDVGTEVAVSLADNSNYNKSIGTLAIATENVLEDEMGIFTTFGLVRGLDTSSYDEGDVLYLGTNGGILNEEPVLGEYVIFVGYCAIKSATIGTIFVNVNASPSETKSIITKEPTGFSSPEDVVVSYDSTTRKITLTGTVIAFWRGKRVDELVSGWVSEAHDNTNDLWFLYYNGSDFVWSSTIWTFDLLLIAFVNYGASNKWGIREPHGLMQWQVHKEFHEVIGTYKISGGDLSNYTLNSTTATERRPYISACVIGDEDLPTANPSHTSQLYTKHYLTSTGTSNFTVETAEIVPLSTNQPYWNEFTGGAWQQTLMANNSYQALWLVAIPTTADTDSQKYRFIWVQGQSNDTTLTNVEARNPSDVNLGELTDLTPELVFITKVIIRYTAGNWRIYSVENLTGNRFSQSSIGGAFLSAVSVDGVTITGNGTPTNPLVAVGGGGDLTKTITIPGELIANTTYSQGLVFPNNTGSTITISNVEIKVGIAAAGTGSSCAVNIYKSSGTATDGIDTNAVNLFTSAIDLTTTFEDLTNVPDTATVETGRWISARITASAGATNKASTISITITYS